MPGEENPKVLALFDFDGTITYTDSFKHFLIFSLGKKSFYKGVVLNFPTILLYKLKLMSNHAAKEKLLKHYFRNWDIDAFENACRDFAQKELHKLVKPKALELINWHQDQGHRVIVVSASPENYLRHWCNSCELEIIGTCLKVENGKITGNYQGFNCYGPEKVKRLEKLLDFNSYDEVYAYGDSRGDKEMLEKATHKFYRKIP